MNWQDFNYKEWKEKDEAYDHAKWQKEFDDACDAANKAPKHEGLKVLLDGMNTGTKRPPWKPNAHYNRTGDQIEVYLSDEKQYVGHWISPGLTLYVTRKEDGEGEGNEVIGLVIEGIERMVQHTNHEIEITVWDEDEDEPGRERRIMIDGHPVGRCLSTTDAEVVGKWLQSAKRELWTSKSSEEVSSTPQSDLSAINATPSPTPEPT